MAIKIYRNAINPDDLDDLVKLVENAGYEAEVVDEVPLDNCGGETWIVVLYPEQSAQDGAKVAAQVGGNGATAIGVWPEGSGSSPVPDYFDDVGSGTSSWEPSALKAALDEPRMNTPDDCPREVPCSTHKNC